MSLVIIVTINLLYSSNSWTSEVNTSKYADVANLYTSGDINGAISTLQTMIDNHNEETNDRDVWLDITNLLNICTSFSMHECFPNNLETLDDIVKNTVEKKEKYYMNQDLIYHRWNYSRWFLKEDRKYYIDSISDGIFNSNYRTLGITESARGNILAAKLYVLNNNLAEARNHLDSAIAALTSSRIIDSFTLSTYLRDILGLLAVTNDPSLATKIYYISGDFIAGSLSFNVPELFLFRIIEGGLLNYTNDLVGAFNAFTDAERLLQKLKLPPVYKDYYTSSVYVNLSLNCLLRNDFDCASRYISKSPYYIYLNNGEMSEKLNDWSFVTFLSVYVLINSSLDINTNPIILESLKENLVNTGSDFLDKPTKAYQLFALAASLRKSDRNKSNSLVVDAAQTLIEIHKNSINNTSNGFVLLSSIDSVIIKASLIALAEKNDNALNSKMSLEAFELSNRTIRDHESQDIIDLANTSTVDEKRKYHAYNRLRANHNKQKILALKRQISRLTNSKKSINNKFQTDFNEYNNFYKFSSAKQNVLNNIQSNTHDKDHIKYIPSALDLQHVLNNDEAFISVTFGHGNTYSLCITKDDIEVSYKPINDLQKLVNDIRIVKASLSADHPPNILLDKQYPVSSSVNIYNTFFDQSLACIKDYNHIIWSPHDELLDIPLSALLAEKPNKSDGGWDLVNAKWLGKKSSFTYATSSSSFIASRKMRREKYSPLPYIGIGDPVLSGKTIQGDVRRSITKPKNYTELNVRLFDLYELPETSIELIETASIYGAPSILYIRENATERNLRREILSNYNIISFATHGLVTNEIDGLNEPALALTPTITDNSLYDGLLTSSEISNLNFSSDFSILSACNTGKYAVENFINDVHSISTAFSLAGSPTTVSSLWTVDSKTSESLIIDLVSYYSQDDNRSIADALRHSTNKHFSSLKDTSFAHPRFWSAYRIYGDGGSIENHTTTNTNHLLLSNQTLAINNDGGEATHISPSKSGDTYITGYEDLQKTGRYRSFVSKVDANLKTIWKHRHSTISNSDLLFETNSGPIIGGYETENMISKPLLYKLNNDGKFLWKKRLNIGGGKLLPLAGFYQKDGSYIGVFKETVNTNANYDKENQYIHFYNISEDGQLSHILSDLIPQIPNKESHDLIELYSFKNKIYITIKLKAELKTENHTKNTYGLVNFCYKGKGTLLVEYDKNNLTRTRYKSYNELDITDIIKTTKGKTVAAGNITNDCTDRNPITLIALNKELSYEVLLQENVPFQTDIDSIIDKNNRLYLVGTSDRLYDIEIHKELKVDDDYYNNLQERLKRAVNYKVRDLFIYETTYGGIIKNKKWLQAGSNIYINDASNIGNKLSIFGAIDGEVSWFQLE